MQFHAGSYTQIILITIDRSRMDYTNIVYRKVLAVMPVVGTNAVGPAPLKACTTLVCG